MASLQDTIRANLTGQNIAPEQQAGAASDQGGALQSLLSARGGKAGGGAGTAGPRLSNVQEQVQQNLAALQQEQQSRAGQTQATTIEQTNDAQAQQVTQQTEQLDQSRVDMTDKFTADSERLIRDFSREDKQLNLQKDAAKLEQLGFNLRLSDEKYINKLKSEGKKARLDNAATFDFELAKSVFADEQELFNSSLEFKTLMKAKDRSFQQELAAMDIETALQIASASAGAANAATLWGGVGNVVSGVVQAVDKKQVANSEAEG